MLQQCLERGGNRYPRMLAAFDVFQRNYIHGVGPGAFFTYNKTDAILNSYPDALAYYNIEHLPAINIFVEMAAEGGIFFLLAFIGYLYCGLKSKASDTILRYIVLVMILGLLFESSIQRSYFWFLLGAASFVSSGIHEKNDSLQLNRGVVSVKGLYSKLRKTLPETGSA